MQYAVDASKIAFAGLSLYEKQDAASSLLAIIQTVGWRNQSVMKKIVVYHLSYNIRASHTNTCTMENTSISAPRNDIEENIVFQTLFGKLPTSDDEIKWWNGWGKFHSCTYWVCPILIVIVWLNWKRNDLYHIWLLVTHGKNIVALRVF